MTGWKDFIDYLPVILTIVQAIWLALFWVASKQFASNRALATERERVTDALHRIELLKQQVSHLPDADDVAQLKDGMAAIEANSREMKARVETAVVGVKRIEDHLLSKSA